jgi:hypothetical protein
VKFLKKIHTFIPGFRRLKSDAMVIAATYYGASVFVLLRYWYWGIALLAAPFLIFNLVDMRTSAKRGLSLAVAAAAGMIVMLGGVCALSAGGAPGDRNALPSAVVYTAKASLLKAPSASPAVTPSPEDSTAPATPIALKATPIPTASAVAALALNASPAPSPDKAQYAYVASKTGKVFHLPGCPSAKRILPQNLVGFKTREEAITSGRTPCKICNP